MGGHSGGGEWRSGPGKPPEGPARFQSPLFFDTLHSWGKQVGDKERGNNILNREVNHKFGRGTWFQGDLVLPLDQIRDYKVLPSLLSMGYCHLPNSGCAHSGCWGLFCGSLTDGNSISSR